ncbi:MAG: hypothetical protein WA813_05745, partial [Beijerinckiaceae bacterium]
MYGHEHRAIDYFVDCRNDAKARQHAHRNRHKNNRRRLFGLCSAMAVGGRSICHVSETVRFPAPRLIRFVSAHAVLC